MAGVVVSLVLDNFKGPMAHRMVLVTLADHANKDGSEARPGMQRLADRAGISKRHTRRIVSRLCEDGWIYPTSPTNETGNPTGGRSKVTNYQINLDKLKEDHKMSAFSSTGEIVKADTTNPKGGHHEPGLKDRTVLNHPSRERRRQKPKLRSQSKSDGWMAGKTPKYVLAELGVNGSNLEVLVADDRITVLAIEVAYEGLDAKAVRSAPAVLVHRLSDRFDIKLAKGEGLSATTSKLIKILEQNRRKA